MINNRPIASLPEEPGDSYLQGSVTVTLDWWQRNEALRKWKEQPGHLLISASCIKSWEDIHGHQSPINHYQQGGSSEHLYHEIEPAHDQTPPPPYADYEEPMRPDNNNNNSVLPYPVQRVQSDSSSINRGSNSAPNSSRSNTTSPNHSNHSTKSSIERAESLHKDSLSNCSTPSPAGSEMHQSHSHQSIPMRSSASTPAGGYQVKKNYSSTLPHGRSMSGQYLSSSTSQISKMRRHTVETGC